MDRDFVRLWIASRYVAPAGQYVCASADQALPFASGAFHGIFCSDAFHYFLYRAACVREMIRSMATEGILVVARFGNAAVQPREGYELSVDGYRRLFADIRHVVVGEDALVNAYTERRSADLDGGGSEGLERQKWLSLVGSRREDVFVRGGALAAWPHAVGRLRLNPLYTVQRRDSNGDLTLQFQFPSEWYEFENSAYLKYAPERVVLPGQVARALERGEDDPSLARYVRQFVVIGLPERYCDARAVTTSTAAPSEPGARAAGAPQLA